MRIIKMSKKHEFPSRKTLENYFKTKLFDREIIGRFNLTKGRIRKSGPEALVEGELLLFTWDTELVRIGRTLSQQIFCDDGYEKTSKGELKKYPSYFVIDMDSLRVPKEILFQTDLDNILSEISGREIKTKNQGFNWIQESKDLHEWFNGL